MFEEHRQRFVAARGALRETLAKYAGCEPGRLEFQYGAAGKPALASGDLHFNLSHSRGLALYAVARGREVGVDIEKVRREAALQLIAARFFPPEEAEALRALPPAERVEAFFRLWTRKEAYIKARGEGLRILAESIDPRWTVLPLEVGPGYAAALGAEGSGWEVKLWQWMGEASGGCQ